MNCHPEVKNRQPESSIEMTQYFCNLYAELQFLIGSISGSLGKNPIFFSWVLVTKDIWYVFLYSMLFIKKIGEIGRHSLQFKTGRRWKHWRRGVEKENSSTVEMFTHRCPYHCHRFFFLLKVNIPSHVLNQPPIGAGHSLVSAMYSFRIIAIG